MKRILITFQRHARCATFAGLLCISGPIGICADETPNSNYAPNDESVKAEIKGEGFVGDFYCGKGDAKCPGILFFGGSEGGRPDEHLPEIFAANGYPVLAVAYFKEKGLPQKLQMVPLEYFDKAIAWMEQYNKIQHPGIVIIGASKGAELALLLASRKSEVKGVIALSPSSVVWNGIPEAWWPPDSRSSWSLDGKPVPFVPYDYSGGFNSTDPRAVYLFYEHSLKQTDAVAKATIPVEKISGPVLLASGHDDLMWPSEEMGNAICDRLRDKGFKYSYQHLKYPDAGHTMNEYFMLGGTVDGNRRARLDLTIKMLTFLKGLHRNGPNAPR